jgi:hypothetical protein
MFSSIAALAIRLGIDAPLGSVSGVKRVVACGRVGTAAGGQGLGGMEVMFVPRFFR